MVAQSHKPISEPDLVNALDELFGAIDKYRTTEGFRELLAFLQRLPGVGPYNALLRRAKAKTVTRSDWWLGIVLVCTAIIAHALLPRYGWRDPGRSPVDYVRIDRWTGAAQWGQFSRVPGHPDGAWIAAPDLNRARLEQLLRDADEALKEAAQGK